MASAGPAVIVLVDDDAMLLQLLSELLHSDTRIVDTVCGRDGLTPDLISLSQPNLVILNPSTGGLSREQMAGLVNEVRQSTQARFVLMVNDEEESAVGEMVKALGADSSVPIRMLLRDPLAQLLPMVGGEEAAAASDSGLSKLNALAADDIMSLELDAAPQLPPPLPKKAMHVEKVKDEGPIVDLGALIDDELAKFDKQEPLFDRYDISVDTLTDHNLYVERGKDVKGVFVATPVLPRVGTQLTVRVQFPWGQALEWKGSVAWARTDIAFGKRRKTGFGVAVTFSEEDQKAVARMAQLRAPMTAGESKAA
jgi:DNA-binding NarL/FixJ family response regulator